LRIRAIDLFCGAGGLSLGLAAAGFQIAAAIDSWQLAVNTYTKNLSHAATCLDIRRLSCEELCQLSGVAPGEVDLLAGGPPCQGFSIQRIGADRDPRNSLVLDFARFVDAMKPRVFLMENVTGLLGRRGLHVFRALEERVATAGYAMRTQVVDAADYSIPQRRKRVLVIGWRADESEVPPIGPCRSAFVSVWDAIGDLPPAAAPGSVDVPDPLHVASRMSDLNRARLALIPPGGGFEDLPVELRVRCHARGAAAIGHRGVYGRLDPEKPAATITARFDSFTRGRFAHPFEDRNITLREGARLQTFPDRFELLGNREEVAAQIGNAIPPKLAKRLGKAIKSHLEASP
jgi:DNA (cytosine-5)-methyltransferase 1